MKRKSGSVETLCMKRRQRMTLEVTVNENRRKSQEVKTGYHCVYE